MRHRLVICLVAVTALAAGCGQRSQGSAVSARGPVRDFPMVQIPGLYTDADDRQAYAAEHFWDRFFAEAQGYRSDSSTVCGVSRDRLEELFATYVTILDAQDISVGKKGMEDLFGKVEATVKSDSLSNVYDAFAEIVSHYLYDPNSPLRNEDLYGAYAAKMAASPLTDPALAPALASDARLCALNAIGTPAADFRFTDAAGRTHRLHGIRADYTLLFFSNPGCEACKDIISSLETMPSLKKLVSDGRLAVVNVYIDRDVASWRDYQASYPKEWYNGYDPTFTIRDDLLYHVRAIPSLYLLDADKRVLLKDAPEERVFAFLSGISRD